MLPVAIMAGALPLAPALAFVPEFAAPATATAERREEVASYRVPVGPWSAAGVPATLAEGAVSQTAWRLDAPGTSTLELLQPLRAQIAAAGFATVFECETMACGGFDFRYGTQNLPEPDMHVDLGDFRFLSAERQGPKGKEFLSLVVSRSADRGYVQLTLVGPEMMAPPVLAASTKSPGIAPEAATAGDAPSSDLPASALVAALEAGRAAALDDLAFASGNGDLAAGDYASLADLARWLRADSSRRVALVGHTDSSGDPAANLALSLLRAQSVRQALVDGFGIAPDRLEARGAGADAPRADNATAEGRAQNRRVEVEPTPTP
jgi:OOP family OmpA-OmpF porin